MCQQCYKCSVPVSVLVNDGQVSLPDVDRLSKGTIRSVFVRRNASGTRKDDTGKTLAAEAVVNSAHLHLFTQNGFEALNLPVEALVRDYNAPQPLALCIPAISTASSYIKLDTTASGYNAAHVIELIFEIECPSNC